MSLCDDYGTVRFDAPSDSLINTERTSIDLNMNRWYQVCLWHDGDIEGWVDVKLIATDSRTNQVTLATTANWRRLREITVTLSIDEARMRLQPMNDQIFIGKVMFLDSDREFVAGTVADIDSQRSRALIEIPCQSEIHQRTRRWVVFSQLKTVQSVCIANEHESFTWRAFRSLDTPPRSPVEAPPLPADCLRFLTSADAVREARDAAPVEKPTVCWFKDPAHTAWVLGWKLFPIGDQQAVFEAGLGTIWRVDEDAIRPPDSVPQQPIRELKNRPSLQPSQFPTEQKVTGAITDISQLSLGRSYRASLFNLPESSSSAGWVRGPLMMLDNEVVVLRLAVPWLGMNNGTPPGRCHLYHQAGAERAVAESSSVSYPTTDPVDLSTVDPS